MLSKQDYKAALKLTTEERNKWYKALVRENKALAIAYDVIHQIELDKLEFKSSNMYAFVSIESKKRTMLDILKETQLQNILTKKSTSCTVCALGGAFMCAVRLGNDYTVEDKMAYVRQDILDGNEEDYEVGDKLEVDFAIGLNQMKEKLLEAFTHRECGAIEALFENRVIQSFFNKSEEYIIMDYLYDNDLNILKDKEVVLFIMNNIIENKDHLVIPGIDLLSE